ncbi:MAG: bifunctional oligoribonuclease/PAP phosphatase NrnA [Planctomycetes bacterium]|nr:bifunctional oligoribonuclease/PAP phosphatase NrnA [Planctomycetota bacterium]MCK5472519.1 bifunctional oligoribonuclease/PAP phosphatase NrnA [Planctomycetota bacterium]
MLKASDFQKAVELIEKSENILITTHIRPDGDACGSVVAIADAIAAQGKNAKILLPSESPKWYEFLFDEKPLVLGENVPIETLKKEKLGEWDLIILADVNSNNQLSKLAEVIKQADKPVLVFDHHITGDGFGTLELVDTSAAATGLIIFDFIKYAGWQINEKIAQAIFVAVATDTGWFRFNNTDSRVHQAIAELIAVGVKPSQIYHNLYNSFTAERFELMVAMLNTVELHFGGRYASQHLLQADFDRTGATHKDTESLINECQRINTVEVAALFVELEDGRIKCSLRSTAAVDVRKIASKFGGGGHTMASGVHLPGPMENAKQLIFEQIEEQMGKI